MAKREAKMDKKNKELNVIYLRVILKADAEVDHNKTERRA